LSLIFVRRVEACRNVLITGDVSEFERFGEDDLQMCKELEVPWVSQSYSLLALAAFWKGDWPEALTRSQRAVELEPPGVFRGCDLAFNFLSAAYTGDRAQAMALLGRRRGVISLVTEPLRAVGGLGREQIALVTELISLQSRAAAKESLLSVLRRQRGGLPVLGEVNSHGSWMLLMCCVEGLATLGEREAASRLYPLVLEPIKAGNVTPVWAYTLAQRQAGIAAAEGGQWELAEEHYERALEQAHEIPHRLEQPEVRRWYAGMLLERDRPGDREKARRLLDEAIPMFRDLGMSRHLEMAAATMAAA
jgi:tetratricopeptide (TPR) repeat protein